MKKKTKQVQPKKPFKVDGKNADKFEKLKRMVDDLGVWNINFNQFATEMGIPNQTVYSWKDKILSEMPPIDIKKGGNQVIAATEAAIRQCQMHVRTAPTLADKSRFMSNLCSLAQTYTDMLEKYGHKEKVAEKHLIFGSSGITVKFLDPETPDEQNTDKVNKEAQK